MHFHLSNCHGEWTFAALILAQAPLLWAWARTYFALRGQDRD
jgi:hypothetical protein